MNRTILAVGFIVIAFFVAGCSDECDLQCPPNGSESSQAIDVLVVTALANPEMAGIIPGPLLDTKLLPAGSIVDTFSLLDYSRTLVVPSIEFLRRYDALLIFTNAWPLVDPETDAYDTIGNLMAAYIDAGGGLVMCQFMINGYAAGIRGRMISPGYAPLKEGVLEYVGKSVDRTIMLESLDFPLHPVFHSVDIDSLKLCSNLFHLGRPELDETAVLLAVDDQGTNAIAVNAGGSIIGLNMYFKAFAFPDDYAETIKLVANSLLYVSDADMN